MSEKDLSNSPSTKEQFTFKPKQELNSSTKMVDQDKTEESPESPTLGSSTEYIIWKVHFRGL